MSKYFYEWHWEQISNLHIGEDGLESWDTEDFDFGDSLFELFGKSTKAKKQILDAINNDTHRITIQKWKDDGNDCYILDYADVHKCGKIIKGTNFGRLPKRYKDELKPYLGGK
tara:strand:+ start:3356 stop:3694 length:339 start_codon:yes stop_codon:yes gene_type:complete